MTKLSTNIARHEVACKCGCGYDSMDYLTIIYVQAACDYFSALYSKRVVLNIHSGCRCLEHNTKVRGEARSKHLLSRAIDHSIREVTPEQLYWFYCVTHPGKFGVILYDWGVHFDTRSGEAYRDDRRSDKTTPIPEF